MSVPTELTQLVRYYTGHIPRQNRCLTAVNRNRKVRTDTGRRWALPPSTDLERARHATTANRSPTQPTASRQVPTLRGSCRPVPISGSRFRDCVSLGDFGEGFDSDDDGGGEDGAGGDDDEAPLSMHAQRADEC